MSKSATNTVKFICQDKHYQYTKPALPLMNTKITSFTGTLTADLVFTNYAQGDFEDMAKQLFVCKEDKQVKRFDRLFVSLAGHRLIKRFI